MRINQDSSKRILFVGATAISDIGVSETWMNGERVYQT